MTAAHATPASFQAPAERNPIVVRHAGCTIAGLHGDLDFNTAPAVRECLHDLLSTSAKLLIIDLSEVSSSDAAGLAVLIGTQRRARACGITVRVAAPCRQIAELLCVTGLDSHLNICATLADALSRQQHELRIATSPQPVGAA
jgi:anti-anti-sigma factor